jgi:hypothetical protein
LWQDRRNPIVVDLHLLKEQPQQPIPLLGVRLSPCKGQVTEELSRPRADGCKIVAAHQRRPFSSEALALLLVLGLLDVAQAERRHRPPAGLG